MKRNLLLGVIALLICILIVTGCGNGLGGSKSTLTCTKEEIDEEGLKTSEIMKITYNDERVLKISVTSIIETGPEYVDMQMSIANAFANELSEVDGISMKYTKTSDKEIKLSYTVDYNKVNKDQLKEKLGGFYNEDNAGIYGLKSYTIEEFKKDNLEGYTCK